MNSQRMAHLGVRQAARLWAGTAALLVAMAGSAGAAEPAAPSEGAAKPRPITIDFVAEVNGRPFDCRQTYRRIGRSLADWQPVDLRLYVSEVVVTAAASESAAPSHGGEVEWPVELTDDGVWQQRDVALLDFEDRSGTCQNGTEPTHRSLAGSVAAGASQARGLRFVIGVPFAKNHADASAAMPPLDQAGLFWGWQAGYKFFTLDGRVNGRAGHSVHLGSTGCTADARGAVSACSRPNRATIFVPHFNAERDVVVLEVGALLALTDLSKSADAHHNGCMGEADNEACAALYAPFHLPGHKAPPGRAAPPLFHRRLR